MVQTDSLEDFFFTGSRLHLELCGATSFLRNWASYLLFCALVGQFHFQLHFSSCAIFSSSAAKDDLPLASCSHSFPVEPPLDQPGTLFSFVRTAVLLFLRSVMCFKKNAGFFHARSSLQRLHLRCCFSWCKQTASKTFSSRVHACT